MLKLSPLFDRAFISYADIALPNEVGGIILPPDFDPNKGVIIYVEALVIATGPTCQWLKVGQKVIVPKSQIERIKLGNDWHYLINEKSVNGIVADSVKEIRVSE